MGGPMRRRTKWPKDYEALLRENGDYTPYREPDPAFMKWLVETLLEWDDEDSLKQAEREPGEENRIDPRITTRH